jgi:hypothetical protein
MFGAIFALIILPLIIICTSVVLYYISGKQEDMDTKKSKM